MVMNQQADLIAGECIAITTSAADTYMTRWSNTLIQLRRIFDAELDRLNIRYTPFTWRMV
jgi:hypothetical protein